MTLPHWLLAGVLASAALLAFAVATPEPEAGLTAPHPEHATLLVSTGHAGGPGGYALGWALGALQPALFAGAFALGMRRRSGLGRLARPICLGLLAYEAVWAALVASSAVYAREGGALWGGFPAPTAWMLYGLWPLPLFFAALFWLRFDSDFLSQRDLEAFRARLREIRERGGS